MRKLFICLKSLIAAPVMLVIAYLLSLPFYYFALTWQGGSRVSLLENFFVLAWAVVGFVAFRWLDRIFRDDGSGDLYSIIFSRKRLLCCQSGEKIISGRNKI